MSEKKKSRGQEIVESVKKFSEDLKAGDLSDYRIDTVKRDPEYDLMFIPLSKVKSKTMSPFSEAITYPMRLTVATEDEWLHLAHWLAGGPIDHTGLTNVIIDAELLFTKIEGPFYDRDEKCLTTDKPAKKIYGEIVDRLLANTRDSGAYVDWWLGSGLREFLEYTSSNWSYGGFSRHRLGVPKGYEVQLGTLKRHIRGVFTR